MITTSLLFATAMPFIVWGIIAHLIADWLLQNSWMAEHKVNWKHPAAWVHAGIHTLLYLFVFHWVIALLIGGIHLMIDTRKPLKWWSKVVSQLHEGEAALHIIIWRDQVLHIVVIAIAALLNVKFFLV